MSRSKQKGSRIEREIVERMKALGCDDAERVPMSGQLGGKYKDDVSFTLFLEKLTTEVKARANGEGFAVIEKWLGDADALFLRKDKAEPLTVLPWRTWAWIVRALVKCGVITSAVGHGSTEDFARLERPAPAPKKAPAKKAKAPATSAPTPDIVERPVTKKIRNDRTKYRTRADVAKQATARRAPATV